MYARSFIMKYFIRTINCLLLIAIILLLVTEPDYSIQKIDTEIDIKKINSLKLNIVEEKNNESAKIEEEKKEVEDTNHSNEKEQESEIEQRSKEEQENETIKEEREEKTDVLDRMIGTMSGYGSDCSGCRGMTASGYDIKHTIYYEDKTYGKIRILSGDKTLKFGSIIRIKNSKLGEFIGIVLDRGGSVGLGKSHLFDLLFSSEKEASSYEVSYDVTFEVLRYGY